MSNVTELYLNRRAHLRVGYHASVRFTPDPAYPLRLQRALTQDVGLGGMQVLSPAIVDREKSFDIWLPADLNEVLHAKAKVVWFEVEDTFGDSPYWIRCGLKFLFSHPKDREALAELVAAKSDLDRIRREQDVQKVGYVF